MRQALLGILLAALPALAAAQSPEFGVRGLGFPGRALAVRTLASGGAFGLSDPESSQNPASLGGLGTLTSTFTAAQSFLRVENLAGSASVRSSRFPQLMIGGPVPRTHLALGFSFSNYTTRDFSLASSHTVTIRGEPVGVTDTLSSRGGLNDFRLAAAYRLREQWGVGIAFHIITGSNRLTSTRVFDDPAFLSSQQRSELSFAGVGVSAGLMRQFGQSFGIAAVIRSDGQANMDRDSLRVASIDLPYSFGLAVRGRPGSTLDLAAQATYRTWSGANSDLLALGGTGARNTIELAAGAEYVSDPRRPYRRPLRLGAHYATLPFPLTLGGPQGRELGVSAGTGVRFAQQRAGVDLALEHVWRSEGPYRERGFILSLGISVRP